MTEKPAGLQSMGSQKSQTVRQDLATKQQEDDSSSVTVLNKVPLLLTLLQRTKASADLGHSQSYNPDYCLGLDRDSLWCLSRHSTQAGCPLGALTRCNCSAGYVKTHFWNSVWGPRGSTPQLSLYIKKLLHMAGK